MTRINIEAFDEEELLDLHARIVERLAALHRKRTAQALAIRYQPGMQVMFDAPGLGVVSATVVRPNQKTVTVRTETGRLWRVAPDDLLAMEDAVKILVEKEMPFLALSQEDYEAWIRANVLDVDDEAG